MNRLIKSALLSVSLLVVSAGAIAGNIPAILVEYPKVSPTFVELLTTIPSLFIVLTVLLSPKIARVIGYKTTILLGILLVIVGGVLPVVSTSFTLLFFSRVLFGIGIGLFNPLLYTFATNLYEGKELATVIGSQSAFEGIGGMLITFLVGQLLGISWRISFLAYLLAVPVWVAFAIFVPKIKLGSQDKRNEKKQQKKKISVPFVIQLCLLLVTVTVYMSVTIKITALLLTKGIGGAMAGSNLIALIGFGAMIAGMLFGKTISLFGKWTITLALVLLAGSLFILAFAEHILIAGLAAVLCGFAFRTFIPYLFNEINQQAEQTELNTAILLIVFNSGAALAPVVIAFFQQLFSGLDVAGLFMGEGLLILLLAVGTSLAKQKTNGYFLHTFGKKGKN